MVSQLSYSHVQNLRDKMDRQCGKCGNDIKDIEPARCSLCETYFHVRVECCDVTRSNMQQLFSCNKALWLCAKCRAQFERRTLRAFIDEDCDGKASAVNRDDELAALRSQVSELTAFVATLQREMTSNHDAVLKKMEKMSSETNPDNPSNTSNSRSAKRRRRDFPDDAEDFPQLPSCRGTNAVDLSVLSLSCNIVNEVPPDNRFYIYLRGLNPKITDDDVVKLTKFCLKTTADLKVGRLVPKNADVSRYTFVSYKIGVDPSLKEMALLTSTWPVGLFVREFEDDSSKNQPAKINTGPDNEQINNMMDQC